ncbi:MAG: hypothetical protein AAFN30_09120, partial [Actinomycetota bacterium]
RHHRPRPAPWPPAAGRVDQWTVEHLGADMPLAELGRFIGAHDVDLVVVSATGTAAAERAAEAKVRIEAEHEVPVLIGGGGAGIADLLAQARQARSARPPG